MSQNSTPAGSRLERKKEKLREKIISITVDLINKQGFNKTSMEQIAEKADIAKKTLYNYFPVKEAIVTEYYFRSFKEQESEIYRLLHQMPDTRSRLIALLTKILDWVEQNREIAERYLCYRMQSVFQSLREQTPRSVIQEFWVYIIEQGQKAGELRQDIPVQTLVTYLDHIRTIITMRILVWPGDLSIDKGITRNVDLFLNGAKKDKQNFIEE